MAICGRGNPLLIKVNVRHGHLTCSTHSTMHNSPFERFPVRPTDHLGHEERINNSHSGYNLSMINRRFLVFCGIFKRESDLLWFVYHILQFKRIWLSVDIILAGVFKEKLCHSLLIFM